jgi:hypothetical protein
MSIDTIFMGTEFGTSTSSILSGNSDKPILFYFKSSSKWWKVWEYRVGYKVNIGNGGLDIGTGLIDSSTTVSWGNKSYGIGVGISKMSFTKCQDVNWKNNTAGIYEHTYIRPWTLALAAVLIYYFPAVGPALPASPALVN